MEKKAKSDLPIVIFFVLVPVFAFLWHYEIITETQFWLLMIAKYIVFTIGIGIYEEKL